MLFLRRNISNKEMAIYFYESKMAAATIFTFAYFTFLASKMCLKLKSPHLAMIGQKMTKWELFSEVQDSGNRHLKFV